MVPKRSQSPAIQAWWVAAVAISLLTSCSKSAKQDASSENVNEDQMESWASELGSEGYEDYEEYQARHHALDSLLARGEPAIPYLIDALGHRDPYISTNAAKGLLLLGEPAMNAMLDELESIPTEPRTYEIKAVLAEFGGQAEPRLTKMLNHSDNRVRAIALRTLSGLEPPSMIHVASALDHPDRETRLVAAQLLERCGTDRQVLSILKGRIKVEQDSEILIHLAQALAWNSPDRGEVLPGLLRVLSMPDARPNSINLRGQSTHEAALGVLTNLTTDSPSVTPQLIDLMQSHEDALVHLAAIHAFKNMPFEAAKPAVPTIISAVKDNRYEIDRQACEALIDFAPNLERHAAQIIATMASARIECDVYLRLCRALGTAAVPELKRQLFESSPPKEITARALAQIGPEGVESLVEALQSDDQALRKLAIEALRYCDHRAGGAIPHLNKLVRDEGEPLRIEAVRALGRIADQGNIAGISVDGLIDAAKSPESRPYVVGAIYTIILRGGRPREAIPLLIDGLYSEDEDDQQVAIRALGYMRLDANSAYDELAAFLKWAEGTDNHNIRRARTALEMITRKGRFMYEREF